MKHCTVYGLLSTRDGVVRYVGQTTRTVRSRLLGHLRDAERLAAENIRVASWILRERAGGFRIEALTLEHNATWNETEVAVIAEYRAAHAPLLNMTRGGDGGGTFSGRRHTEETKQRMSISGTGRIFSADHRARLSAAKKGSKGVPGFAGHTHTSGARARISAGNKGRTPWIAGRRHPEEVRQKISSALIGKPATLGMTGRTHTAEATERMSAWSRGDEHIQALRNGHKTYAEKRSQKIEAETAANKGLRRAADDAGQIKRKLSPKDIEHIRGAIESANILASQYGVHPQHIRLIRRNKRIWQHV